MATNWDSEMQDKFDKLQAALTAEFRTQFKVMSAEFQTQFKVMGAELEERLEQRLDERLGNRLNVQAEQLRELVQTAADNYGGVLDSIKRDLAEFRSDWRKETANTGKILANHNGRIAAIEKTLATP